MNCAQHRLRSVLTLAILVATGCGGGGSSSGRHLERTLDFREGIITFSDPAPRTTVRRLPTTATTIVLTTRTRSGELVAESQVAHGSKGKVGNRSPRDIFLSAARRRPKVLTTDQFAAVWRKLVDVGLLDLPSHPEDKTPTNVPSIQVNAEGKSWIFLRPVQGFRQQRTEQERKLNAAWAQAKVIISEA